MHQPLLDSAFTYKQVQSVYTHTHTQSPTHTQHTHTRTHTHTHIHTNAHIHTQTYAHTHKHAQHTRTHTCTHTHTITHTNTHTHTQTHTHITHTLTHAHPNTHHTLVHVHIAYLHVSELPLEYLRWYFAASVPCVTCTYSTSLLTAWPTCLCFFRSHTCRGRRPLSITTSTKSTSSQPDVPWKVKTKTTCAWCT